MDKKIIMLTAGGQSSVFMYNGLKAHYPIAKVVIEGKGSRKQFLKRRAKRLGYWKVFGQVLFQAIVPRFLKRGATKRIEELTHQYQLDDTAIPDSVVVRVPSINSQECLDLLRAEQPDLIIVNGTRIISKKVLNSVNAVFLNTHAGITPKYRGVHGGYWALAKQDRENCGVTVHLVDPGIDTGGVVYQATISPTEEDNFITYTYAQIGEGIRIMKNAIADFMKGELKEIQPASKESKLYYHPTLWYYLRKRFTLGVK